MITREWFKQTAHKCTFEEYVACDCTECNNTECPHRNAFRRLPESDGGLGLCPNLKTQPEEEKQIVPRQEAIKDTKSQMNDISVDLVDEYYDTTSYIYDAISDIANNRVDIYNYDLIAWLQEDPEAVDWIEEAVEEFSIETKDFDFYNLIRWGQYLQAERQLYNDVENIAILSALYCLTDDASEDVINAVCDNSRIYHCDRFDDIADAVWDILTELEEEEV